MPRIGTGLEKLLDRGEALDVTVLGLVSVARDVTPDLVDRVVMRFRHRGVINASDEVRAALKRKSADTADWHG